MPDSIISQINPYIIRTFGRTLRLVQVVEYPKCGGTWMARMLRTCIGIDREYGLSKFPRSGAVIQTHRLFNTEFSKNIVLIRDPRDVLVSFYFHERYLTKVKLFEFDSEQSEQENFLRYIKHKILRPEESIPGFNYSDFVASWQDKPDTVWIRYEAMQDDAHACLAQALDLIGLECSEKKIRESVEAHTFEKITGRKPGNADPANHKRKGIVGDWKNYFNPEIASFVHEHVPLIYELGYESDDAWVATVKPD